MEIMNESDMLQSNTLNRQIKGGTMGKLILNGKEYIRSIPSPFPPIIYSKEEREVGVWADGKPLYQKTWECTLPAISGSTTGEYVSLINLPDVSVKKVEAYGTNGATLYPFTGYSGSRGTQLVNFRYLEGYIKLYDVGVPYSAGEAITVTAKYTKNSDTPGSGHWGTNGAPAKHYSTTEQIVGTWIDGKPLYEKTVIVPISSCTITNKVMTIPFTSANEKLLRIVDAFTSDSTYSRIEYGGETHASNSTDANYIRFGWYYGSFCLYTANTSYWTNLGDITIIYQYTKTTD